MEKKFLGKIFFLHINIASLSDTLRVFWSGCFWGVFGVPMINPGCFGGVQGNLSLHQRVEHAAILAPFLSACLHGVAEGVSVKEAVLRP